MRTRIPRFLIALVLLGPTPAASQLPPEILADSYLLEVEQAYRDGNYTRAWAKIQEILRLQSDHNLNLPEFDFWQAKVADSVDFPEQALESVLRYLTIAGREGQHYIEALKLMNKVQAIVRCKEWETEEYFEEATNEAVLACLGTGIDLETRNDSGRTALHRAASHTKNPVVIEALVKAGADLEALDKNSHSPLAVAVVHNENPRVIATLIRAGANPKNLEHILEVSGTDPKKLERVLEPVVSHIAKMGREVQYHTEMLEVMDKIQTLVRCKGWETDGYFKIAMLEEVIACLDLDTGVDLEARNDSGRTALHRAVGHTKVPAIIEALLKAGADLHARNKDKNTPLLLAARNNGNAEVIEVLLKAGADLHARGKDNNTPLHFAARNNGNAEVVEVLLKAGADLHARNKDKNTPLLFAARNNGNAEVVEVLLKAGADLGAQNEGGDTSLQVAKKFNKNPAVRQALLAVGAGQIERQLAVDRARRKTKTGGGWLGAAIGIAGGTAIAAAGGGSEESLAAGTVFAEGVIRGQSPARITAGSSGVGSAAGNVGAGASSGPCEIPGYPRPANVQSLGLAWCPASVDFQVRSLALQAAGAQCAIATGSSSTSAQIQARRQEIQAACARLAAMGVSNCQCPSIMSR